jgi:NAD(P)-dependent dehydrogenase (short-subunit alcohol dehydrogenase family)
LDLGLKGKRALITGASQGIGETTAEVFAEEGCSLRLVARNGENLERIAADLRGRFAVDVAVLPLDLSERDAAQKIVDWAGDVDILINNAGVTSFGDLWAIDDERWRTGFDLKFFAAVDLARLLYPAMKARGGGVIVNNIGLAGETYDFNYVMGTSICAALTAFTRSLGSLSLNDGIRVMGVSPGPVAVDYVRKVFGEEGAKRFPGGRIATTREVADLFAFLASPRSGYTSGSVVLIDGGIGAKSVFA